MEYDGIADGGPLAGQRITAKAPVVTCPIIVPNEPGFGQFTYVWNGSVWAQKGLPH